MAETPLDHFSVSQQIAERILTVKVKASGTSVSVPKCMEVQEASFLLFTLIRTNFALHKPPRALFIALVEISEIDINMTS